MTIWFNPEKKSIQMLKDGNLEGLRWIYDNFSKRILNQCYRILLSREQAEDTMQDIFLKLPETIAGFRSDSGLGTWLFKVAHNMCLTRLEQAKNRYKLEVENVEDIAPQGQAVPYEVHDMLNRALAVLDPETRSLLWLKDGEGVPIHELSKSLNLPEGTIKAKLSRARTRLRELLEKESEYVQA